MIPHPRFSRLLLSPPQGDLHDPPFWQVKLSRLIELFRKTNPLNSQGPWMRRCLAFSAIICARINCKNFCQIFKLDLILIFFSMEKRKWPSANINYSHDFLLFTKFYKSDLVSEEFLNVYLFLVKQKNIRSFEEHILSVEAK